MLIRPFTKNAPKIHEDKPSGALRACHREMIATGPEAAKMNATRPLTNRRRRSRRETAQGWRIKIAF